MPEDKNLPSGNTTAVRLITRSNTYFTRMTLFNPTDDARFKECTCSITLDHIGTNPDALLGITIGPTIVPLRAKPANTAARLPCGHTFNAMALIVHFTKNNMQCPLCRNGSAHDRLDLALSFPHESWVPKIVASVLASSAQRHHMGNFADVLMPPSNIEDLPVHAAFVIYSVPPLESNPAAVMHRLPTVSMRCRLELVSNPFYSANDMTLSWWFTHNHNIPPLCYRLPSAFARLLEDQMRDMSHVLFHVHIYAAYAGIVLDMAHMECTPYPLLLTTAVMLPPADKISFATPPTVSQLVYTPSQATLTSIFAMMQAQSPLFE